MNIFWSSNNLVYYIKVNSGDGSAPRNYGSTQKIITPTLPMTPNGIVVSNDTMGRFFVAFSIGVGTNQDLGVVRVDGRGNIFESIRYLGTQDGTAYVRQSPSITTDSNGQIFVSYVKNPGVSTSEIDYVQTILRNNYMT
jgi:hypothetical protein